MAAFDFPWEILDQNQARDLFHFPFKFWEVLMGGRGRLNPQVNSSRNNWLQSADWVENCLFSAFPSLWSPFLQDLCPVQIKMEQSFRSRHQKINLGKRWGLAFDQTSWGSREEVVKYCQKIQRKKDRTHG